MKNYRSFSLITLFVLVSLFAGFRFIGGNGNALISRKLTSSGVLVAHAGPENVNEGEVPILPLPQVLHDKFSAIDGGAYSPYTEYRRLVGDHDLMNVQIPVEWGDIETGPWTINGKEVGEFVAASSDLDSFYNSGDAAGIFFGASHELAGNKKVANPALEINPAITRVLSTERATRLGYCQDGGRFAYQDSFYRGQYDLFLDCANGERALLVFVVMPANQEIVIMLQINMTSLADLDAATRIFESYQVYSTSLEDPHHSP